MSVFPKVGILGASGRTGRTVKALVEKDYSHRLTLQAAPAREDPLDSLLDCDVVIDFSSVEATLRLGALAVKKSRRTFAWVVGTTGFSLDERRKLEEFAEDQAILLSSNFSLGMLAYMEVLKTVAPLFEKMAFKPVLTETHHQNKKDAPSGTALSLQRILSATGPGNIQTHSIRVGDVVGIHEVSYFGPSERLSFRHEALDRAVFGRGAVEAALWLLTKKTRFKDWVRGGTSLLTAETFFSDQFGKSVIEGHKD